MGNKPLRDYPCYRCLCIGNQDFCTSAFSVRDDNCELKSCKEPRKGMDIIKAPESQ